MKRISAKILLSLTIILTMMPFSYVLAEDGDERGIGGKHIDPFNYFATWFDYDSSSYNIGIRQNGTLIWSKSNMNIRNQIIADNNITVSNGSNLGIRSIQALNTTIYPSMIFASMWRVNGSFDLSNAYISISTPNQNTNNDTINIYDWGYGDEFFYVLWAPTQTEVNPQVTFWVNDIISKGTQIKVVEGYNTLDYYVPTDNSSSNIITYNNSGSQIEYTNRIWDIRTINGINYYHTGIRYYSVATLSNRISYYSDPIQAGTLNTLQTIYLEFLPTLQSIENKIEQQINGTSETQTSEDQLENITESTQTTINQYTQLESTFQSDFNDSQTEITGILQNTSLQQYANAMIWFTTQLGLIYQSLGDMKILVDLPLILGIALFIIGRGAVIFKDPKVYTEQDTLSETYYDKDSNLRTTKSYTTTRRRRIK